MVVGRTDGVRNEETDYNAFERMVRPTCYPNLAAWNLLDISPVKAAACVRSRTYCCCQVIADKPEILPHVRQLLVGKFTDQSGGVQHTLYSTIYRRSPGSEDKQRVSLTHINLHITVDLTFSFIFFDTINSDRSLQSD